MVWLIIRVADVCVCVVSMLLLYYDYHCNNDNLLLDCLQIRVNYDQSNY